MTTGWHAGLFCVYLTAGKKRFLRFSEACDYYNLGLVHIRRLARETDAIYRIYGAPQLIEREKLDQYSICRSSDKAEGEDACVE